MAAGTGPQKPNPALTPTPPDPETYRWLHDSIGRSLAGEEEALRSTFTLLLAVEVAAGSIIALLVASKLPLHELLGVALFVAAPGWGASMVSWALTGRAGRSIDLWRVMIQALEDVSPLPKIHSDVVLSDSGANVRINEDLTRPHSMHLSVLRKIEIGTYGEGLDRRVFQISFALSRLALSLIICWSIVLVGLSVAFNVLFPPIPIP